MSLICEICGALVARPTRHSVWHGVDIEQILTIQNSPPPETMWKHSNQPEGG